MSQQVGFHVHSLDTRLIQEVRESLTLNDVFVMLIRQRGCHLSLQYQCQPPKVDSRFRAKSKKRTVIWTLY